MPCWANRRPRLFTGPAAAGPAIYLCVRLRKYSNGGQEGRQAAVQARTPIRPGIRLLIAVFAVKSSTNRVERLFLLDLRICGTPQLVQLVFAEDIATEQENHECDQQCGARCDKG